MKRAYVNPNQCDRSPLCPSRRACPVKAISQEKLGLIARGPAVVNSEACISCGKCIPMCPHGAITLKSVKNVKTAKKK